MEIKKINVDRKPLATEYIQSKQDFQHVLANYKKAHIPVFKQPLFYGVIGFASLAALITVSVFNINPIENEEIITSKIETKITTSEKTIAPLESEVKQFVKPASIQIGKSDQAVLVQKKVENTIPKESIAPLSQTEVQTERKTNPVSSNFPHVSGISEGAISVSQLCNGDGILMRNGSNVVSFKFQYISGGVDKLITVSGNKIPQSVCAEMSKSNLEQLVFITDIEAKSINGVVNAPSMNLWVSNKS